MKINTAMKSLLKKHMIDSINNVPQNNAYPICQKADITGRMYWGVSSFCGIDEQPIHSNQDLSQLEWDGNEVYLSALTDEDVAEMLQQAIGILVFWKNELETRYPLTPFYVFASYDNGDMLILDEYEQPIQSVTLRFWANRGDNTVINLENFESWDQPAIMGYCNFAPP